MHDSKNNFTKTVFIVFGVLTLLLGLFNFIIDPYRLHKKRIPGINDQVCRGFFSYNSMDNLMQYYFSKYNDEPNLILGTSHIIRGVPDCRFTDIFKMGISSMSIEEAALILEKLLDKKKLPDNIYIELMAGESISFQNGKPNRINDKISWYRRFIDIKTLRMTFSTIRNSIGLKTIICGVPDISDTFVDKVDGTEYVRRIQEEEYLSWLSLIDKLNRKIGDHKVNITFFTSPLPYGAMSSVKAKGISRYNYMVINKVINASKKYNNIMCNYIDLLNSSIGADYIPGTTSFNQGWYDASHYKSKIGEKVVDTLLQVTQK
ncbi:hypothetical protein [Galbibacter pacificus]|uniref:SGNH/GDSL hydrolase family protein n=1 Tax=Galbibacter pacificus TaxID=2996052 RepID=A0ABT6FNC5_9FLAO|nr:hypothetical protein [Galbibacter pacificus]MDG3581286.1 hypothetical protein [Galbibacter pacificus]MDG3584764.1 hypothetical protein [Galbibacter pacificus]